MEIKKSRHADLERWRLTGFLLGLVVVLAVFLLALQIPLGHSDDVTDLLLDDVIQDMELMPAMHEPEMLAVAPEQPSASLSERLNIVSDRVDDAAAELEQPTQDGGEGEVEGSTVEQQSATALTPADAAIDDNPLNFRVVEEIPEFPGGMTEFMKWLTRNLKYPSTAQKQKVQGKVLVSFVVERDGAVTNARLVRPANAQLDREALRVVRMMPRWKPGVDKGKPCRTMVCIPIVFSL